MQDFNKLISLFIGLFVVIFVVAFIVGSIKIGNKKSTTSIGGALGNIFNIAKSKPKSIPTPTPTLQKIQIRTTAESQKTVTTNTAKTEVYDTVVEIPKTGAELIFPFVGSILLAGLYIKYKS